MQEAYKMLVVDDESDLETLMPQRMRRDVRAGRNKFVFAPNGVEVWEKLHQDDDIDMVLSDINMPQMDGLTLQDQIPKVDPNIRPVIISAYGDIKNIRTAMNRGDGTSALLPLTDGIPLGIAPDLSYKQNTVALSSGDTVIFYTDGVTEAMNGEEEQFGLDPLSEFFQTNPPRDSEETTAAVFEAVNALAGETPQSDDITCLVLYCDEASS